MKKTYTKDSLSKKLVRLLVKNNALDQYISNMNSMARFSDSYADDKRNAFSAAFSWNESPEGFEFWHKIHNQWDELTTPKNKINGYSMTKRGEKYMFGCQYVTYSDVILVSKLIRSGEPFDITTHSENPRSNHFSYKSGDTFAFNGHIIKRCDINVMLRLLHLKTIPCSKL